MTDDEHGRDPAAGLTNTGTLYVGPAELSAEDFEEAFALLEDTGALELLDTQPEKYTQAIELALFEAAERRKSDIRLATMADFPNGGTDLLTELGKHPSWELSWGEHPRDCTHGCWLVHEVSGGRNDREWTFLASGATPAEAIKAARSAIKVEP